jgi:uncharacterized membrane protein
MQSGENTMNSKLKLAAIALVAAVGATPAVAFAQELQTGTAANREQLFGNGASGFGAYAKAPGSAFVSRHGGHIWRHHRSY